MKYYFLIPPILFLAFIFLVYLVLPQWSSFGKIKNEVAQKAQELQRSQAYFAGLKNDLAELSAYEDSLQKIETALPGELALAPLISFFNEKAGDNGLILKSMAQSQAPVVDTNEAEKPQTVPSAYFIVSLTGQVSAFESFLTDIETSARLVEVQNIALQQQNEAAPADINLFVKVYY